MVYRINADCIACGACSIVCSQDAVADGYTNRTASLWQGYQITDACSGCGDCAAVCPVGAISVQQGGATI